MSKELDGRLTRVEDVLRNEGMTIAHRVAYAISARDKEWVERIEKLTTDCDNHKCKYELDCVPQVPFDLLCHQWKVLKKEAGL